MDEPDEFDVNELPPTQLLLMEVLAARHRLGETWWTLDSKTKAAAKACEALGLLSLMHGIVPQTYRAAISAKGLAATLSPEYVPPILAAQRRGEPQDRSGEVSRRRRIWWNGRWYRMRMRMLHRYNLCWMQRVGVEDGYAWCHWCGMRGRFTSAAMIERAVAEKLAGRAS